MEQQGGCVTTVQHQQQSWNMEAWCFQNWEYRLIIMYHSGQPMIWHTNKYTTGEPSGVPADDVTNYPNDNGHPYGNNVVEKIYEIRDII